MLDDEILDLVDRVAGCLVLLYALPLTRVNRLRTNDFEATEDGLALRMGDDLVPVPPPLASLVKALAEQRCNVSGAEHPRQRLALPRPARWATDRARPTRRTTQPPGHH